MKTIFSIVCCLLLVATTTSLTTPQDKNTSVATASYNDNFMRFNAHKQGKDGIAMTWVFTTPNNAVSFVVERSYDGSFYERIADLPAINNHYKDSGVYPGYIYYRIAALMYDGSTIYSNVDMVRIVRNG